MAWLIDESAAYVSQVCRGCSLRHGRTLDRLLRSIPGRTERGDRIERPAPPATRLGDEWPNVGLIGALERAFRHDYVSRILIAGQRFVRHEARFRVRLLELIDCLEQRLDRVLEVVALIDHVRRLET